METIQELINRISLALAHPADDPYVTTIVVLIVVGVAVMLALGLIAFALPSRRDSGAQVSAEGTEDAEEEYQD